MHYSIEPGEASSFRAPLAGPYDRRLGYSRLDVFLERLTGEGFEIDSQANPSTAMVAAIDSGLFPIYWEKPTAGLWIKDRHGSALHAVRRPERIYEDFDSIPKLVADTLLFIENREALETRYPYKNPAVEWDRFANASLELTLSHIGLTDEISGGSTLATQLEKLRHSPGGQTSGPAEKLRQMLSASLRSYSGGRETFEARKRIVTAYLNSLPLAAIAGYGEVHGLGDGLWAWFGADFEETNRLLANPGVVTDASARAYREVISLLVAIRKPTALLVRNHGALNQRVDRFLRLLAREGVISAELRDRALEARTPVRRRAALPRMAPFYEHKATDSVRIELLETLELESAYELDRLDLTVESTLDGDAQRAITEFLGRLQDSDFAARAGLRQHRLLAQGDPAGVIYSVTLYERQGGRNLLRVQADNLDQPLNISEGTKLELGSTAKLRTLSSYLLAIARLHERLAPLSQAERSGEALLADDPLTEWAVHWLNAYPTAPLAEMLEASMLRRYSGSPDATFFTGGGLHRFSNFDAEDNARSMTVREAFQRSVNLVFVRLMRDLITHRMYQLPGLPTDILTDVEHPERKVYLERFAELEGRQYPARFHHKYKGLRTDEALALIAQEVRQTPRRLAAIHRLVKPWDGIDGFAAYLIGNLLLPDLPDDLIEDLYREFTPGRYSLADRAYIAGVHPLELRLLEYKARHPGSNLSDVLRASGPAIHDAYEWFFRKRARRAQDRGIRVMLEVDAFEALHKEWRRMGYPFQRLVPSLATALGSSGDTPASLSDLVGIIANDGVYYPSVRIERLHFARGTPFETNLVYGPREGDRVLPSEVAALLRQELVGVVERGTARRASRAILTGDGTRVAVGGKTGTGDNRYEVFGPSGQVMDSRVINRTATFIFLIGDRYFGTVTAFVPGEAAAAYGFTSSLPVQIFRELSPAFLALMRDEPAPDLAAPYETRPLPSPPPNEEALTQVAETAPAPTSAELMEETGIGDRVLARSDSIP